MQFAKGGSALLTNQIEDGDDGDIELREGAVGIEVGCTQVISTPIHTHTPASVNSNTTSTNSAAPPNDCPTDKPLAWLKPLNSSPTNSNTTPSSLLRIIPLCPGTTSIGRDATLSDIQLKVNSISRRHAFFEVVWPCAFIVHDGKSKNGTYVNEKYLGRGGKQALKEGDQVTLGEVSFMFTTTDPNMKPNCKSSSSSLRLSSQRKSATPPTGTAAVHQSKAAKNEVMNVGIGANLLIQEQEEDICQETVDDPIVCYTATEETVFPVTTTKTAQVVQVKTSSSRKRKLNVEQAPNCSLPAQSMRANENENDEETEGMLPPSLPTTSEDGENGKGKRRRNVYSMLFQQPRRSSVYFEEQTGNTSANSSFTEQQPKGSDFNSSHDMRAYNNCLVEETLYDATAAAEEREHNDRINEDDDDEEGYGEEEATEDEDEEDDDPPFALMPPITTNGKKEVCLADRNHFQDERDDVCAAKCDISCSSSKEKERRLSYNYMVDDTLVVTETDESAGALAANTTTAEKVASLFEPQIFPIPKNLLNDSRDGVLSPPPPQGHNTSLPPPPAAAPNDNHFFVSETCEQDLQYSPRANRLAGNSAPVEVKEANEREEEESNVLGDLREQPFCHSSPHSDTKRGGGGSEIEEMEKSPSMFLTNLYHQQTRQLQVQSEDIDDVVTCLSTPSPPAASSDGVDREKGGKTVVDDIYNQETIDVDDFEEEVHVEETPSLAAGLLNKDPKESERETTDINQNIHTPLDGHEVKEASQAEQPQPLSANTPEVKEEEETSCSVLEDVNFSSDDEVASSCLNGSNMLTNSQVQLVNKTISSINTPMRDRMKRRRKAKLEEVEGGACVKFAWDTIGTEVKDNTDQRVLLGGDLEMAATYEDDEFVDGTTVTGGSAMLSCLKMEVAAIDSVTTKATKGTDGENRINTRKRAAGGGGGGGRKKNQLALLQSQEIDFQDGFMAQPDATSPPDDSATDAADEGGCHSGKSSEEKDPVESAAAALQDVSSLSKRDMRNAKKAKPEQIEQSNALLPTSNNVVTAAAENSCGESGSGKRTRGRGRIMQHSEKESGHSSTTTSSKEEEVTLIGHPAEEAKQTAGQERKEMSARSKVTSSVARSTRKRVQIEAQKDKKEEENEEKQSSDGSGGRDRRGGRRQTTTSTSLRSKRGKSSQQQAPTEEDDQVEDKQENETDTDQQVVAASSSKDIPEKKTKRKNTGRDGEEVIDKDTDDAPQVVVTQRVTTFQQQPVKNKSTTTATAASATVSFSSPVKTTGSTKTTSDVDDDDSSSGVAATTAKGQRSLSRRAAATRAVSKKAADTRTDAGSSIDTCLPGEKGLDTIVNSAPDKKEVEDSTVEKKKRTKEKSEEEKEEDVVETVSSENSSSSIQSRGRRRAATRLAVLSTEVSGTPKSSKSVKFRENTNQGGDCEDLKDDRIRTREQTGSQSDEEEKTAKSTTVRRSRKTTPNQKQQDSAVSLALSSSKKTKTAAAAVEVKKEALEGEKAQDGANTRENFELEDSENGRRSGRVRGRGAKVTGVNTELVMKQEPVDENSSPFSSSVRGSRSRQQINQPSCSTATSTSSSKQRQGAEVVGGGAGSDATTSAVGRRGGARGGTPQSTTATSAEVRQEQLQHEIPPNESSSSSSGEKSKNVSNIKQKTAVTTNSQVAGSSSTARKESPQKSRSGGSSGGKIVYIVFTGIPETVTSKYTKQLVSSGANVQIGDDVSKCTCLVTDKIKRTVKFLCALSQGTPIVAVQWVEACIQQQTAYVDAEQYLLKDEASEKKFEMTLESSLTLARQKGGVLNGLRFFVTQSVMPPPNDMKSIIKSAQGQVLPRMPAAPTASCPLDKSTFIISCEKDMPKVKNEQLRDIMRSVEFILSAIMRQQLDVSSHRLL